MPKVGLEGNKLVGISSIELSDSGGSVDLYQYYIMRADGILRVVSGLDSLTVRKTGTIQKIKVTRITAGTSGSTKIDINLNGTTIFTTQANRPTISYSSGNNYKVEPTPDITTVTLNNILTFDIDQVEGGNPEGAIIELEIR